MKVFLVILYVFVFQFSNGEPSLPNDSSKTKVDEDKPTDAQIEESFPSNATTNFTPSSNSGSNSNLSMNMNEFDITGESTGLNCPNIPVTDGESFYHRVYVGQNTSGSSIYTSSPTKQNADSFAKEISTRYIGLNKIDKSSTNICQSNLDQNEPSCQSSQLGEAFHETWPELVPLHQVLTEFSRDPSQARSEHLDSSMEAETTDDPQSRIHPSLHNFVVAVNMLQTLVEDLDANVGSYRRLSTSLIERPQELVNLIDEISSSLWIMSELDDPSALVIRGADSEQRVISVSAFAVFLNEQIERILINFESNVNEGIERDILNHLLQMLRLLSNDIGAVIESVHPVVEYYESLD